MIDNATPATLGRIVHFVDEHGNEFAAVITKVWPGEVVNLRVFADGVVTSEDALRTSVSRLLPDSDTVKYRWNFPERV